MSLTTTTRKSNRVSKFSAEYAQQVLAALASVEPGAAVEDDDYRYPFTAKGRKAAQTDAWYLQHAVAEQRCGKSGQWNDAELLGARKLTGSAVVVHGKGNARKYGFQIFAR